MVDLSCECLNTLSPKIVLNSSEIDNERVCRSVCLSGSISLKLHVPTSPIFVYATYVARSYSGNATIRYVLSVSWITSEFPSMAPFRYRCSDSRALQRYQRVNAAAALYWLRPVIDDVGAKSRGMLRARSAGGKVCYRIV